MDLKEYILREDAMNIPFTSGINDDGICYVPLRDITKHLRKVPAADVVEVVRCRDCQFYDISDHICELYGDKHFEGFYCHDGSRCEYDDYNFG